MHFSNGEIKRLHTGNIQYSLNEPLELLAVEKYFFCRSTREKFSTVMRGRNRVEEILLPDTGEVFCEFPFSWMPFVC